MKASPSVATCMERHSREGCERQGRKLRKASRGNVNHEQYYQGEVYMCGQRTGVQSKTGRVLNQAWGMALCLGVVSSGSMHAVQ